MSRCDICGRSVENGDVLCDGCREAITRLKAICDKRPELLGGTALNQISDSEAGPAGADDRRPSRIGAHSDK